MLLLYIIILLFVYIGFIVKNFLLINNLFFLECSKMIINYMFVYTYTYK